MTNIHPSVVPLTPISEGVGTGDPSAFHPKVRPAIADAQPVKLSQGSILSDVAATTEQSD